MYDHPRWDIFREWLCNSGMSPRSYGELIKKNKKSKNKRRK